MIFIEIFIYLKDKTLTSLQTHIFEKSTVWSLLKGFCEAFHCICLFSLLVLHAFAILIFTSKT